jgi:glyoxylase I family protein
MALNGVAHVAITVKNLELSKEWYGRVLSWRPMMSGEAEGVVYSVGSLPGGPLIGLREYAGGTGVFDPRQLGLDHLAFDGESPDGLKEWERRFDELGVPYSPTQETPYGYVLNFKDPDGIALEIYAAPAGPA